MTGCDLEGVAVAEPASEVVAEVYVLAEPDETRIRAFLHRTVGSAGSRDVPGARILVEWDDGASAELEPLNRPDCLVRSVEIDIGELPDSVGSCYGLGGAPVGTLGPGSEASVTVDLPDGARLRGATRIPGDFQIAGPPGREPICHLSPDTELDLTWSSSEEAWSYVTETLIRGLPEALEGEVDEPPPDPLFLLGLSLSGSDTTIAYPRELGIFERFDLDRDLALALQNGLPDGTSAWIGIGAGDRNYVNWLRGGNFNPSGQIRIPSLQGDGTGVFASLVLRSFEVTTEPDGLPPC